MELSLTLLHMQAVEGCPISLKEPLQCFPSVRRDPLHAVEVSLKLPGSLLVPGDLGEAGIKSPLLGLQALGDGRGRSRKRQRLA
jgi:hypothetical protein